MNVSGIQSDSSLLSIYEQYGTQSTDSVFSTDGTLSDSLAVGAQNIGAGETDSASFSRPSEFFSKLQQLKSTDPEKFKQVCTDIANKLRAAAQEQSNGSGSKMLTDLASKFDNVANGGDISQLKPPAPPNGAPGAQGAVQQYTQQDQNSLANAMQGHHGHHGHHSGGGDKGGMRQLMSSIFDEVDQAIAQ